MKRIAVVLSMLEESCQSMIWDGIQLEASKNNVELMTFPVSTEDDNNEMIVHFDLVKDHINRELFDGLIIFTGALTEDNTIDVINDFLKDIDIPIVSVASKLENITSVIVDNSIGIIKQVNHLVKNHNKKRIVFIKGPDTNEEAIERLEAYKQGLIDADIPYRDELVFEGDFSEEAGELAVNKLVEMHIEFDAIIGADDYTVMGALKSLKKESLPIPSQIAIVGFDDIDEATMISPSLSTVQQPFAEMGKEALKEVISNQKSKKNVIKLNTKPIHRDSCGCVPDEIKLFRENLEGSSHYIIKSGGKSSKEFMKFMEPLIEYVVNNSHSQRARTDQEEYRTFIKGAINRLWTSFFTDIETEEGQNRFINLLTTIIAQSEIYDTNIAIWKHILTRILPITPIDNNYETLEKMRRLQQESRIVIDQHETNRIRYDAYEKHEEIIALRESCQRIILSDSDEKLFETISEELIELGINDASLVIFNHFTGIPKSEWHIQDALNDRVIIRDGRISEKMNDDSEFTGELIFPTEFREKKDNRSSIFLPIFMHGEYYGYLIATIEAEVSKELYQELRIHISSAIQSTYLMDNLKAMSMKDELTGLSNRRGYMLLAQQLQAKALASNSDLLVFYFDMDGLKYTNDTFGHDAGDNAIKITASLLERSFRTNDIIGRIGGDEFTAIVRYTIEGLEDIIEKRLRELIKVYNENSDYPYDVDMSIGSAVIRIKKNHKLDEKLKEADAKMLENKRVRKKGRDSDQRK